MHSSIPWKTNNTIYNNKMRCHPVNARYHCNPFGIRCIALQPPVHRFSVWRASFDSEIGGEYWRHQKEIGLFFTLRWTFWYKTGHAFKGVLFCFINQMYKRRITVGDSHSRRKFYSLKRGKNVILGRAGYRPVLDRTPFTSCSQEYQFLIIDLTLPSEHKCISLIDDIHT